MKTKTNVTPLIKNQFIKTGIYAMLWVMATFVLYWFQLSGGWRVDDFHHLLFLSQHTKFEYIYSHEAIRLQSGAHYTPFNILTYDVTYRFFPLTQPFAFYGLHLILIGLAASTLFAALSQRLSVESAALGSSLFLLGFPIAGMSGQLMVDHYVIGFIFAGLFLYYYERSENNRTNLILSVAFYFLACTAKELFIPLIALIAIDPRKTIQNKIRVILAYAISLTVYLAIRTSMIGQFIGGYNGKLTSPIQVTIENIYTGIFNYFTTDLSAIVLGIIITGVIAHATILTLRHHGAWNTVILITGITAIVTIPLTPVADRVGPQAPTEIRFISMAWWLFAIISAVSISYATKQLGKRAGIIYGLILMSSVGWHTKTYIEHSPLSSMNKQFDAYSQYVINRDKCHLIDDMGWSSALADLHSAIWPNQPHPMVAPLEIIKARSKAGDAICAYKNGQITQIDTIKQITACDFNKPLGVKIDFNGTHISFEFKSDEKGDPWYYLEVPEQYLLKIDNNFTAPWPNHNRLENFRVLKITQDGGVTCSPLLHFKPDTSPTLNWQR